MGGNALSVTAVRLTKKNFERVSAQCIERLQACFPGHRVAVIPAYRAKADFGDCDILVTSAGYDPNKAAAALDAVEVVRNGPVTSVGVVVRDELPPVDGNVFQVDLIAIGEDAFDYALGYFSFNDLGNLIGRTAHRAGLSHKHDGLWFYVRDGDYKFREICLTRDYDVALRFLGYEPARFHAGFETLGEIFEYVSGSTFFNRDIFLLENRNAKSRIRDRKRRTYMEFLKWCEARPELPAYPYPDDKSAWLPRIAEHFPHFEAEYQQALKDMADQRAVKVRFNGEWVAKLTGLQGKDLGALMKNVKESFDSQEALHQFVLGSSEEQLAARVREVHATLVL
ncbi:hypothetical protein WJ96_06190 [Burkholderia ubonensis]|uniref:Uncharacterized protein n=1 Tax=Burkholderia ubonensis TaxID=101571 RepID=A0AAW3MWG3_9BURK|nr:hypothetical protein [Burkholderia ubonensis]KVP98159.1 hypothetical protein WJ96_06190 [Burkholderia ubonensis]KVZ92857.1 hypothetical protein WL25_17855 [Burkholderia ubonensis]